MGEKFEVETESLLNTVHIVNSYIFFYAELA
jgi:hypothetical protein